MTSQVVKYIILSVTVDVGDMWETCGLQDLASHEPW